jgi:hypothetical protein
MKTCQRCKSDRLAFVSAKCGDQCFTSTGGNEYNGLVPSDLGVGGADYVTIEYCLACGQLQGKFPLAVSPLEKVREIP